MPFNLRDRSLLKQQCHFCSAVYISTTAWGALRLQQTFTLQVISTLDGGIRKQETYTHVLSLLENARNNGKIQLLLLLR